MDQSKQEVVLCVVKPHTGDVEARYADVCQRSDDGGDLSAVGGSRTGVPGAVHVWPPGLRGDPSFLVGVRGQDVHRGPYELFLRLFICPGGSGRTHAFAPCALVFRGRRGEGWVCESEEFLEWEEARGVVNAEWDGRDA